MPKAVKTPGSVLLSHMTEYQLNPFSLSKAINLSNSSILQIINGKGKITIPTALRLSKFFGNPAAFWLDLQRAADINEAASDKELSAVLAGITKAKKPAKKAKVKPLGKTTLKDKRKQAAKTPGAKPAARNPKAKKAEKDGQ